MSTEHVITRSVRDSAALLDVTCGPDVGAPYFAPPPATAVRAGGGRRAGAAADRAGDAHRSRRADRSGMRAAVREAAKLLEGLGHHVEETDAGCRRRGLRPGVPRDHRRQPARGHRGLRAEDRPPARRRTSWRRSPGCSSNPARRAARPTTPARWSPCTAPGGRSRSCSRRFDLILTPTLPKPPQRIGTFSMMTDDPDAYGREVGYFTSFTAIVNVAGNPGRHAAAALDAGWPAGRRAVDRPLRATKPRCCACPRSSSRRGRGSTAGRRSELRNT